MGRKGITHAEPAFGSGEMVELSAPFDAIAFGEFHQGREPLLRFGGETPLVAAPDIGSHSDLAAVIRRAITLWPLTTAPARARSENGVQLRS